VTPAETPPPPHILGAEGQKMWAAIIAEVAPNWRLDARDLYLLTQACRLEDTIAKLELAIGNEGEMSTGSKGQPVVHPAIPEARQLALAQARLLEKIELEDPALRLSEQRARTASRTADWRRRRAQTAREVG